MPDEAGTNKPASLRPSGGDLPISAPAELFPPARSRSAWWLVALLFLLLLAGAVWYFAYYSEGRLAPQGEVSGKVDQQNPPGLPVPSRHGPQIALSPNSPPAALSEQDERKAAFGLRNSLDVVVRSDESIVVSDTVVPMAELERQLNRYRGQMSDQNLNPARDPISAWGAHLVRPGDNLWQIHLSLLREYMASRGVILPPGADQPKTSGYSSGVGKILKFAEHMVGVYNIKTGEMSHNLNLLEPGEKIVVFNLSEIFAQLSQINPKDLSGVMYDGRVLIFPKQP